MDPKPEHRFLPGAVKAFVVGGARRQNVPVPERLSDTETMRLLHDFEDALKVKIEIVNHRLFRVVKPRAACLPNGQRVNVQQKWHGSKPSNGLSILSTGFKTGWTGMFGAGIYVGDRSKAIRYSGYSPGYPARLEYRSHLTGSILTPASPAVAAAPGMLIQVEVVLGRVFNATEPMNKLRAPPDGFDSVRGVAGVTSSWGGTLRDDEWVVYDPRQVTVQEIHLLG